MDDETIRTGLILAIASHRNAAAAAAAGGNDGDPSSSLADRGGLERTASARKGNDEAGGVARSLQQQPQEKQQQEEEEEEEEGAGGEWERGWEEEEEEYRKGMALQCVVFSIFAIGGLMLGCPAAAVRRHLHHAGRCRERLRGLPHRLAVSALILHGMSHAFLGGSAEVGHARKRKVLPCVR